MRVTLRSKGSYQIDIIHAHSVVMDDILINPSLNLTLVMVKTSAGYNIVSLKEYHGSQLLPRVHFYVSEPVALDSRKLTGKPFSSWRPTVYMCTDKYVSRSP